MPHSIESSAERDPNPTTNEIINRLKAGGLIPLDYSDSPKVTKDFQDIPDDHPTDILLYSEEVERTKDYLKSLLPHPGVDLDQFIDREFDSRFVSSVVSGFLFTEEPNRTKIIVMDDENMRRAINDQFSWRSRLAKGLVNVGRPGHVFVAAQDYIDRHLGGGN